MDVRVRFAPSPTGFLHVGGLRTLLFNYFFSKKNQGKLILRIEDTDRKRFIPTALPNLLQISEKLNITYDESPQEKGLYGPYIQSERQHIYKQYIKILLDKNCAYKCFCSVERLEKMRTEQIRKKQIPKYDGCCRRLSTQEVEQNLQESKPHVIRMKIRHSRGVFIIPDLILKEARISASQVDDQVIIKADGMPTYHFACVVDDHLMKISHVIRGNEWLASTPKHLQLYEYFEWSPPLFAHIPLILNADRSKLSKRQNDTSTEEYLTNGYLPEALINFLVLLGWNPGNNQEIMSRDEITDLFSLEKIGKSPSIFDLQKLQWVNQQYILKLPDENILQYFSTFIDDIYKKQFSVEQQRQMILLVKSGINALSQINQVLKPFIFEVNKELSSDVIKKYPNAVSICETFLNSTATFTEWNTQNFSAAIKSLQKTKQFSPKELWKVIRLSLTTQEQGPELAELAVILGKNECHQRIKQLLSHIEKQ